MEFVFKSVHTASTTPVGIFQTPMPWNPPLFS